MRASGLLALVVLPFLFSCSPLKPEIFGTAVPAGPLILELEQHRHAFSSLKAVARVEIEKRGRKRAFDTVGVVVDGQRRLFMEAYSPLGQSLMAVVWDGKDVLVRLPDEHKVVRTGPAGLEKLLGQGLDPAELCAALSGNIPPPGTDVTASEHCGQESICTLELRNDDFVRRVRIAHAEPGSVRNPQILAYALYRSDKLLFRARFDHVEEISGYSLPMQIAIESPDKNLRLTVIYSDVEINAPVSDGVFTLTGETEDNAGR